MKRVDFENILACPRCKIALYPTRLVGKCKKCKSIFIKSDGIWNLLYTPKKTTVSSLQVYNKMHKTDFGGPNDGSYEILASLARGNKAVDIACGEGLIEKLSPETVGVDFSVNALKKAQKNGAKNLVLADAHYLPFNDNSFDISISAGSLEHMQDPQKVINEMARVSKIQVLTVHKHPPIPFASNLQRLISTFFNISHQPIERPISQKLLEKMLKKAGLYIIFKGVWTLPINYGRVVNWLTEFNNIPSCSFFITIKK